MFETKNNKGRSLIPSHVELDVIVMLLPSLSEKKEQLKNGISG